MWGLTIPTAFVGGCQAALAPESSSGRHGSKSSLTAEAEWTFLQTVQLIPASILFSYIFAPPTTHTDPFCLYHSGLILSMATLSSSLRMPLSEQGIWQGSGLFLIRFLFIPILGSSGLVAYLLDVSDTW